MNKFKIGDILTATTSHFGQTIEKTGKVVKVTNNGYFFDFNWWCPFIEEDEKLRPANGMELIVYERKRQITEEGYDAAHDAQHDTSRFIYAAEAYVESARINQLYEEAKVLGNGIYFNNPDNIERNDDFIKGLKKSNALGFYPWTPETFKPTTTLRDLVKAGALIAAAIDRLQNQNK